MSNGLTPAEALEEMREITRMAALDSAPTRQAAGRYTLCRDTLLQSQLRPHLPGFLFQCLTVARFQDFIHLLDPRPQVRLAFIDKSFKNLSASMNHRPSVDLFDDGGF